MEGTVLPSRSGETDSNRTVAPPEDSMVWEQAVSSGHSVFRVLRQRHGQAKRQVITAQVPTELTGKLIENASQQSGGCFDPRARDKGELIG
jgi:hypothetical protein